MVKEIYYPHELIVFSSFPETLMDFILIDDEAPGPAGTERGRWEAGSLERRRRRRKNRRLFAVDVLEGLSLRVSPGCELALEEDNLGHSGRVSTCRLGLGAGTPVIRAPSTCKWSVLVRGKGFPEVASPHRPGSLAGTPWSVACLCPEAASFQKLFPQVAARVFGARAQLQLWPCPTVCTHLAPSYSSS